MNDLFHRGWPGHSVRVLANHPFLRKLTGKKWTIFATCLIQTLLQLFSSSNFIPICFTWLVSLLPAALSSCAKVQVESYSCIRNKASMRLDLSFSGKEREKFFFFFFNIKLDVKYVCSTSVKFWTPTRRLTCVLLVRFVILCMWLNIDLLSVFQSINSIRVLGSWFLSWCMSKRGQVRVTQTVVCVLNSWWHW